MTNSIGDIVEGLIAAENRLRQIIHTLDKKPVPGGVFEAHALVRQAIQALSTAANAKSAG